MPTSVTLTDRIEEELRLYVEVGQFGNASEAVRRALDNMFQSFSSETRMRAALHAYQHRGVTMTRAAEIAGVPYDVIRERLLAEGLLEEGEPPGVSAEELDARAAAGGKRMKKNRK